MSKSNVSIKSGYLFNVALLIFVFNLAFVTVYLGADFKNTDFYVQAFTTAGIIMMVKMFITTYANFIYSLTNKRWYVMFTDTILLTGQAVSYFMFLISFINDSYPRTPVVYMGVITLLLIFQFVLGKLKLPIRPHLFSFIYYIVLFGMLYTVAFGADDRFLTLIGIGAVATELFMALSVYRSFQKHEIITLEK